MSFRALLVFAAVAIIVFVAALYFLVGCSPHEPLAKSPTCAENGLSVTECGAAYGSALSACAATAKTLCDSLRCEVLIRREFGRPELALPTECR